MLPLRFHSSGQIVSHVCYLKPQREDISELHVAKECKHCYLDGEEHPLQGCASVFCLKLALKQRHLVANEQALYSRNN